jgi:hypothetical protein
MPFVEQRRMIQELKSRSAKLTAQEKLSFDMMVKRDKDDEDLDSLTMARLKQLHAKYFPTRSKPSLDDAWNKLTGGKT